MTEERRPTFAHRVEHALFMSAVVMSGALGDSGAAALGSAVGRLGYFPFRFRRKLVEQHLRIAFPERDDAWIRRIARAAYAHLGREAIATIRLARMSRDDVLRRTRVNGFEQLQAALDRGRGLVLVTGHIGNHEIGAAALAARGIPLDVVAQRQANPLFDAALIKSRERLGLGVIDRFQAIRLGMKTLRRKRALGFAADQNAGRAGVFVPFFGRPASTHRGAALFAVKANAPLFLGSALRKGHAYDIMVEEIEVDRTGDPDDVVYRLTLAFTRRLEDVVRANPEQYLWLHRRWKTRPPEEPQRGVQG